jgi:hypothetical protein
LGAYSPYSASHNDSGDSGSETIAPPTYDQRITHVASLRQFRTPKESVVRAERPNTELEFEFGDSLGRT